MLKNISTLGKILNKTEKNLIKGGVWGYTYTCIGTDTGFSTIGPIINYTEAFKRCPNGFTANPIH